MAVNRLNVGATNQLLAKASSGQSTNILELQNTAGVTVAGVDASGNGVGGLAHPPTFKNLIINGAMQVAQRSTSVASITVGGYHTVDRWNFGGDSLGTWTMSVENDAPTGSGFRKSAKVLCTTADASPAAGDYIVFLQRFEGQNLQQILKGTSSAKELTLSFWVKANVTGTYIAELSDIDNTRTVSKSYTVSASATWEKKTITFPADTTGVLDNDNASSLQLNFWLGAGSTFTGGSPLQTSWGTTTNTRVTGQTNLASATNNYWQITGIQLEVGSVATEFEFKPYAQELQECQRYFYVPLLGNIDNIKYIGPAAINSSTIAYWFHQYPQIMRAQATIAFGGSASDYLLVPHAGAGIACSAVNIDNRLSNQSVSSQINVSSGLTTAAAAFFAYNTTNGKLQFSAEL
jgi:hypothetical protein